MRVEFLGIYGHINRHNFRVLPRPILTMTPWIGSMFLTFQAGDVA